MPRIVTYVAFGLGVVVGWKARKHASRIPVIGRRFAATGHAPAGDTAPGKPGLFSSIGERLVGKAVETLMGRKPAPKKPDGEGGGM